MRHPRLVQPLSVAIALAAAAVPSHAAAQNVPAHPVGWRLTLLPAAHSAPVRLRLAARMQEGWYIYSLTQPPGGPTRSTIALLAGGPYAQDGRVQAPPPTRYDDPNFGLETETYHSVVFVIPVKATGDTGAIAALVRYQTCNDRICLPPRTDTVRLDAARAASSDGPPAPAATAAPRSPGIGLDFPRQNASLTADSVGAILPAPQPAPSPPGALGSGSGAAAPTGSQAGGVAPIVGTVASPAAFLWLAAIMGLLSLLTPCVFPMVPITIAFFARGNGGPNGDAALRRTAGRGATVASAGAYALGIVGAFCGAGVLLTMAFGAGGVLRMAADPWLNLAVTAFFLAFALNLLGVYELRLPAALMSRLGTGSDGHGPGAALLLGAAFAVTTFTCTAPFVGTLLVVATRGDWSWPLMGMLVFAAAFALPFFLLALLPDLLARLPRSGEWMLTLRRALGVLEIAAAAKFLSNTDMVLGWGIFTRDVVIAIWAAAGVGLALVIVGRPGAVHRPGRAPALARAALVALAVGGTWWMTTGLTGAPLGEMEAFLPPPAGAATRADGLAWTLNDFEGSLARARAEHRPIFVDFTGYTCTNCRWMEANMFSRPEVRSRLQPFVRVRLYTDGDGEPYVGQQALEQRMFGTVALPVYAILTATGEPVASYVGMTRNSTQFNEFLARGLNAARLGSLPD